MWRSISPKKKLRHGTGAFNHPIHALRIWGATAALCRLRQGLEDRNQSESRSLAENMEEMLTLHRLEMLGSFKTTNCLESINVLEKPRSCINSSTAR